MTERRWLVAIAAAGFAIFMLSFVNAWIIHDREIRGEGYRHAQHFLSAWRGVGMPVLTIAAFGALATALYAFILLRRPSMPKWPLLPGTVIVLGLVLSAGWPVSKDGHASSVRLSVGFLLPIGAVLAGSMVVGAVKIIRPPRRWTFLASALLVFSLASGAGGRWLGLQWAEGTGRNWSDGSYTRTATSGEPTETLVISDARVAIGERWQGTWEWSGWTVVIDNDPACPDSRGTYHAHGVDEEDLRFVKVVDTCEDGVRGDDLETGIWYRDP
ncbi:hypothetical protein BH23CHL10_BH23CHL10_11640 [soil metagenome]